MQVNISISALLQFAPVRHYTYDHNDDVYDNILPIDVKKRDKKTGITTTTHVARAAVLRSARFGWIGRCGSRASFDTRKRLLRACGESEKNLKK